MRWPLKSKLWKRDQTRLDEYLSSVRDLEQSDRELPPEYRTLWSVHPKGGDLRDWPRIAKLQSDLLVHALASGRRASRLTC